MILAVVYLCGCVVGAVTVWAAMRPKGGTWKAYKVVSPIRVGEVEFWRFPCGGIVGLDIEYLLPMEQVVRCPYTGANVRLSSLHVPLTLEVDDSGRELPKVAKDPTSEVFRPYNLFDPCD